MACNGHNHPKDCKCNFRGGHPNSRPSTWRGWRPSSVRRYTSGPNAKCPECGIAVFYVPGPKGGGTYFDKFGPPWPKHACTNKPKPYSPYGRSGRPKLRNVRSEFEKDGWLPFFVRNIELLSSGTIIHGVVADNPTVRHLGSLKMDMALDHERPIYVRGNASNSDFTEINYFPLQFADPISETVFEDCRTDFDLLLKKNM